MNILNKTNHSPFSKEHTLTINGIFVVCVFLMHLPEYWDPWGTHFYYLISWIRLNVSFVNVPFLLFSGYACMKQIDKKDDYVNEIPIKRILMTIINLDFALLFYVFTNKIFNIEYSNLDIFLSFFAIKGIGNSFMYIQTMCILWLLTYVTCKLVKNDKNRILLIIIELYIIILFDKINVYYEDILMTYALGMIVAHYEKKIIGFFRKKLSAFFVITVYFVYKCFEHFNIYITNLFPIIVSLVLIWILVNFNIKNDALIFFGKNIFTIYIVQRLIGTIMTYGFSFLKPDIAIVLDFMITIIVAEMYRRLLIVIDNKIVNKFINFGLISR